jgi:hypothetical protein
VHISIDLYVFEYTLLGPKALEMKEKKRRRRRRRNVARKPNKEQVIKYEVE